MWLLTPDGFLSIVQIDDDPDILTVRARRKEHLTRAFPTKRQAVRETPGRDYRWRLTASRGQVAAMVARQVSKIDYPNFKAEAEVREARRHDSPAYVDALHRVWTDLGRVQPGGPYSQRSRPWWDLPDDEWLDDQPERNTP